MAIGNEKEEKVEPDYIRRKVKFEVYGEEMIEKTVN